jgi:hypothetical protein
MTQKEKWAEEFLEEYRTFQRGPGLRDVWLRGFEFAIEKAADLHADIETQKWEIDGKGDGPKSLGYFRHHMGERDAMAVVIDYRDQIRELGNNKI